MTIRSEKKFTFNQPDKPFIRDWLMGATQCFNEVFFKRQVNSLYFDTYDFSCYEENLSGGSRRSKARLRWYDDLQPGSSDMTFEMKLRSNQLGDKLSHKFNIRSLDLGGGSNGLLTQLRTVLPHELLPFFDNFSEPSLLVSYQREYYADKNKTLRVTLDDKITFGRPNYENALSMNDSQKIEVSHGVLEVKIEKASQDAGAKMSFSNALLRAGRHSKYALGIKLTRS